MGSDYESAYARTQEAFAQIRFQYSASEGSTLAQDVGHSSASQLSTDGYALSCRMGMKRFVLPDAASGFDPTDNVELRCDLDISPAEISVSLSSNSQSVLVAPAVCGGFGLFAAEPLETGVVIGEYVGELCELDAWCQEIRQRKTDRGQSCDFPYIPNELYACAAGNVRLPTRRAKTLRRRSMPVVIDSFHKGNFTRFINHSCYPNCKTEVVQDSSRGCPSVKIKSIRPICAWEQLSFDYGWYQHPQTLCDVLTAATEVYRHDVKSLFGLALNFQACADLSRFCVDFPETGGQNVGAVPATILFLVERFSSCKAEGKSNLGAVEKSEFACEGSLSDSALSNMLLDVLSPSAIVSWLREADSKRPPDCKAKLEADDIPSCLWRAYEVIGGYSVGIGCRCALDSTLNSTAKCSHLIGRPLQTGYDGREAARILLSVEVGELCQR